uniref:ATP synthase subunit a n=1 Tax=Tetraphalerus bruchi TaxID=546504 RepID=B6D8Y7_TETBR|nr:ATP synthase F0 subunit 6 [Tetraphalerus bruchi]ACF35125.1 ATP synthase F0 subunit 6 [Tetraphalerus bruchi]
MTNLFSTFDPTTSMFNMPLNWSSLILGVLFIPMPFWLIPTRISMIWIKSMYYLHKELKTLLNSKTSSLMFTSLFMMILMNNFLGLMPYIFTSTSHLITSLTLALPLWLSFMIFGWINNTQHMFTHLVPLGTPGPLMPFMVCIETISNIIRPGTLAIRLTANMIAGHLLLTLLGNTGNSMSTTLMPMLMMLQLALLTLEGAVSIIQSYVFTVLSTLYSSEVNYEK